MGGRNVFMGYLRQPEKTKEAIDSEGWLRSGDIGKLDDKGRMFITGRIKVSKYMQPCVSNLCFFFC
jgi:long-subunit acyl-CoA synthetase (AMP-forming)